MSIAFLLLLLFFSFHNCIVPMGFLPWEIWVAFPGESQLQQSHAAQPTVRAGCLSVSIICWVWSTEDSLAKNCGSGTEEHEPQLGHHPEASQWQTGVKELSCCPVCQPAWQVVMMMKIPHFAWTAVLFTHTNFIGSRVYGSLGVTCTFGRMIRVFYVLLR